MVNPKFHVLYWCLKSNLSKYENQEIRLVVDNGEFHVMNKQGVSSKVKVFNELIVPTSAGYKEKLVEPQKNGPFR